MSDIREFRTRLVQQRAERASLLPTIVIAVFAFMASAGAVLYWDHIAIPQQWASLLMGSPDASTEPSFGGVRLGRAETAPLLKICVTKDLLGIDADQEIEAGTILEILNAANTAGRVTAIFGGKPNSNAVGLAAKWGEVADCANRQSSWMLCDIDNRALAIQATNTFVRHADQILAQPANYAAGNSDVQVLRSLRDRVLGAVRSRVKTGVLIAADFSPFAPTAVRQALSEIKPNENACAKP